MKKYQTWIIAAVFAAWAFSTVKPPQNPKGFDLAEFGRLPVLLGGRVLPLDSVARNTLVSIHGTTTVRPTKGEGEQRTLPAIEWMMEAMTRSEESDKRKIFRVESLELRNLLNAREGRLGQLSFDELRPKLDELQKEANHIFETKKEPQTRNGYEKDVMHLFESLILYNRVKNSLQPDDTQDFPEELKVYREAIPAGIAAIQGGMKAGQDAKQDENLQLLSLFFKRYSKLSSMGYPLMVPPLDPKQDRDGWGTVGTNLLQAMRTAEIHPAIYSYAAMSKGFQAQNATQFNEAVAKYRGWLAEKGFDHELTKGRREAFFNHMEPFYKTTIMYVVALLMGCFFWLNFSETLRKSAFNLLLVAFAIHTTGLLFRMFLEGRPPVTNLYSSAVFVGWGAVLLGIILECFHPGAIGTVTASTVGFVTLIIAHNLSLSGDTMEMMRAVLDTNIWLATHVVIINIGYASTFLAGFLAIVYIVRGFFTKSLEPAVASSLVRMVYGIVCFSTLFTFVGTVLGGIWADQSWGRFWGWDPKENGALLIVLANAAILHARWGGIIRERGLMGAAIFGNIVTAWSWFGTNMLGVGLHAYGFMDAAFQWLVAFVISQVLLIALAMIPTPYWKSFQGAKAANKSAPTPEANFGQAGTAPASL